MVKVGGMRVLGRSQALCWAVQGAEVLRGLRTWALGRGSGYRLFRPPETSAEPDGESQKTLNQDPKPKPRGARVWRLLLQGVPPSLEERLLGFAFLRYPEAPTSRV